MEVYDLNHQTNYSKVLASHRPSVLKGLVKNWPAVKSSLRDELSASYIKSLYNNTPIRAFVSTEQIKGRYCYNETYNGFNFNHIQGKLNTLIDQILEQKHSDNPKSIYMGSTPTNTILPGFAEENSLPFMDKNVTPRIWIGNKTRISAHYDIPDNIACVVHGRRRFTLFPTDQIKNLYIGPLDLTPAGQSLSLVDFEKPDFEKYPRFKEALEHAEVATLEPGDAIYIPSLWWHHVEGLDDFNILVNYWWNSNPPYYSSPFDALLGSILSIKSLPNHQKQAWKEVFNHYIFNTEEDPVDHLPDSAKGILGDLTEENARKIRASIINSLNR